MSESERESRVRVIDAVHVCALRFPRYTFCSRGTNNITLLCENRIYNAITIRTFSCWTFNCIDQEAYSFPRTTITTAAGAKESTNVFSLIHTAQFFFFFDDNDDDVLRNDSRRPEGIFFPSPSSNITSFGKLL